MEDVERRQVEGWVAGGIDSGGYVGGVKTRAAFPDGVEGGIAGASVEGVVIETVELGRDKSGSSVENEGDSGGMVRRMAEEDANTGAVLPFIVGVLGL